MVKASSARKRWVAAVEREIADASDDDLIFARADRHQQRGVAAEIDADDMEQLRLGDVGAMVEEARVDRLRPERMEGAADFRRVVVAHRA